METTRGPPAGHWGRSGATPGLHRGFPHLPRTPPASLSIPPGFHSKTCVSLHPPPRAAPPSSARAARLCKPVVSLLLARIKLGTRIFLLDSVPWDLGSRVFCTTSRRYRVTLKQAGRREGGCGSPVPRRGLARGETPPSPARP